MVPSSCSAQQRAGGRERRQRTLVNWTCLIPPALLTTVLCLFMNLAFLLPRFWRELCLSWKFTLAGWLCSSSRSPKPAYGFITFYSSTLVSVHCLLKCRPASQDSLSTDTQPWFETCNRAQKALTCLFDPGFFCKHICSENFRVAAGRVTEKRVWSGKKQLKHNSETNLYQERTTALLQDEFRRAIFCPATSLWLPPCTI